MADYTVEAGKPQSPAGWYEDPTDRSQFRYWDGANWTDHTHRKVGPSTSIATGRMRKVAAGGGAALAISTLLPWVSIVLLGDLNLFQLLAAGGNQSTLAWLAVATGTTVVLVAWWAQTDRMVRLTTVSAGMIAGVYLALALVKFADDVEVTQGLVRVAWGFWVALAACLAMIIAGFISERR